MLSALGLPGVTSLKMFTHKCSSSNHGAYCRHAETVDECDACYAPYNETSMGSCNGFSTSHTKVLQLDHRSWHIVYESGIWTGHC